MAAKEFLNQYRDCSRKLKSLEREINNLEESVDTIRSASDNDGMPHGNNIGRPTEDKAIKLVDTIAMYKDLYADAMLKRAEIFDVIMQVDDIKHEVLYLRYVEGLHWEEICMRVYCSWNSVHRYHRAGLQDVESILGQECGIESHIA